MQHYRTNQQFPIPANAEFVVPETVDAFKNLEYTQRLLLKQRFPKIYDKFQAQCDRERLGLMPWD